MTTLSADHIFLAYNFLQDLPDKETALHFKWVDTAAHVMLAALPKQQQRALVQLSVFPSGFTYESAAAVMKLPEYRARGVIQVGKL